MRVAKTFLEAFKVAQDHSGGDHVELKREHEERERLLHDLKVDDSIHHTNVRSSVYPRVHRYTKINFPAGASKTTEYDDHCSAARSS